ncbi:MAG: Fic family protein [Betaproteobacteria bacterium]
MLYTHPRQFEPLLPTLPQPELDALVEEVCRKAFELKRLVHPVTEARIAKLLRSVNSYYSNRIEGQQTHPRDIERALQRNFSKEPKKARLQRLALAHIQTQEDMEARLAENAALPVYGADFLVSLHEGFYGRLTQEDRRTEEGDEMVPGGLRRKDVTVGDHDAPAWQSVPQLLERVGEIYSGVRGLSSKLIAVACAHHRLAWIHPFRDGNGRVVRLQSQAALIQHGAGSALWSVSRGLARDVQTYYARLADADAPRQGDLDGRGNLSEKGLVAFATHFLAICLDQVSFMGKMLDLTTLRGRVQGYLVYLSQQDKAVRAGVAPAMHYLFLTGSMPRGEFKQATGLPSRTADRAIATLLERGLLESDSARGPVKFGLPLEALSFYFPMLYPEAAT